jgi:hypothetical protein
VHDRIDQQIVVTSEGAKLKKLEVGAARPAPRCAAPVQ